MSNRMSNQQDSFARHGAAEARVRVVNEASANASGRYVLYWMTAHRRLEWNFALDRALELGRRLGKPLVILEGLRADYPWATARSHRFVLDGMAEHAERLADAPVTYYPYVERAAGEGRGLLEALSKKAHVVVADDHPGFFYPRMLAAAAERVGVLMEAVDACGVVPVRQPGRAFPTAHSFRRWLQRNLPELLASRPRVRPLSGLTLPELGRVPASITRRWPRAKLEELKSTDFLSSLPVDSSVPVVADVTGGARTARAQLREFLRARFARYAGERNRAESELTSRLSPYLHFGHLSPQEVFTAIAREEGWSWAKLSPTSDGSREGWWGMSANGEAFLDQLITWRELGLNGAAWIPDHDRYESLPSWARDTLDRHRGDPREHLYTTADFEAAETHDPLWNAAQRQLLAEGRIHNYLRMLWGKKILEWSPSPEEALRTMIDLNNKYALDGRDPNSISGIFWTLGRYDRPWGPEREIYGRIRYMSSENTARKMSVKSYLERYGPTLELGLW
jgi:deoxyribodipyrimidine photo-lyase